MRKTLTDAGVRALKPRAARYAHPDPELAGHYVRVQPSGAKSFVAVTRDPGGKQVWATIGPVDLMSVAESREKARAAIKRVHVRQARVQILAKAETFADVVTEWRTRHLERNGLRAAREINRLLDATSCRRGAPASSSPSGAATSPPCSIRSKTRTGRGRPITVSRSPRDHELARRPARRLYPADRPRHAPTVADAQQRTRILDDDEIRRDLDRLRDARKLRRPDPHAALDHPAIRQSADDGVGRHRRGRRVAHPDRLEREKPHGGELKLPQLARDLLAAMPVLEGNPFVFAGRGQGHTNGHSKNKARLDQASGVTDWVVHDLRRTGRRLLSRAGVRPTSPSGRWVMSSRASQPSTTGTPISTRRRTRWRSWRR